MLEQPRREVAALTQLRDRQVDRADPRVPAPRPIPVARVDPLVGALAVAGLALRRRLADINTSAKVCSIARVRSVSASGLSIKLRSHPAASIVVGTVIVNLLK